MLTMLYCIVTKFFILPKFWKFLGTRYLVNTETLIIFPPAWTEASYNGFYITCGLENAEKAWFLPSNFTFCEKITLISIMYAIYDIYLLHVRMARWDENMWTAIYELQVLIKLDQEWLTVMSGYCRNANVPVKLLRVRCGQTSAHVSFFRLCATKCQYSIPPRALCCLPILPEFPEREKIIKCECFEGGLILRMPMRNTDHCWADNPPCVCTKSEYLHSNIHQHCGPTSYYLFGLIYVVSSLIPNLADWWWWFFKLNVGATVWQAKLVHF